MSTQNPYKPEDEIRYQSWEHGRNSENRDDCPYEKGTLEADVALPAWESGFRAGQKERKRNTSTTENNPQTSESKHEVLSLSIESADDETLMAELRRRKLKEYDNLQKAKAEIDKQLERLRFLFND